MIRQTLESTNTTKQDSLTQHSLLGSSSWKGNLNLSQTSRTRLITSKSVNNIQGISLNYLDNFKKHVPDQKIQNLQKQNGRLKRQVDKLTIQVSMLKKSQQQTKSAYKKNNHRIHQKQSPHKYNICDNTNCQNTCEELKRLRNLLEKSYYSMHELESQKKMLHQLVASLTQQLQQSANKNTYFAQKINSLQIKHLQQVRTLQLRIQKLTHKFESLRIDFLVDELSYRDNIQPETADKNEQHNGITGHHRHRSWVSLERVPSRHKKQTKQAYKMVTPSKSKGKS